MTTGILALFKSAGVTPLQGHGKLLPGRRVQFTAHDGTAAARGAARRARLGFDPGRTALAPFKAPAIVDSWGALEIDAVPRRLGVIGAGVIGLELGGLAPVWSQVVVLEALPEFLAIADQQVAKEALRHFKKQGLDIRLGAKVTGARRHGRGGRGHLQRRQGRAAPHRRSRGGRRRPPSPTRRTCWTRARGSSSTNAASSGWTRTVAPGRRTSGRSGTACAGRCCAQGQRRGRDGRGPDRRTFRGDELQGDPLGDLRRPEIAWVGQTEEQVKASGRDYKAGVFPFLASGRARAMEQAARLRQAHRGAR